jgi:radical SAM protein with 4Fe4S-binding SPASM domain
MKSSLGEEIGDFALGTIEDGIGIKQEHKDNINLLDSITMSSQSTDECINCPIAGGCGWCTAYNFQETGSPNKRCTYICWMHRARSLAIVYYWNKVFKKNNIDDKIEILLRKEHALQIIDEEEYNMLSELVKKDAE